MSTINHEVSRRSFLFGAGALGAASVLTMAGCSPQDSSAAEGPTAETGAAAEQGRWSWSVAPQPIADDEIAETIDCEILILGAGSGGVFASTYAALSGADVAVMTKGEKPGAYGWSCASYNNGTLDVENGVKPYDPVEFRSLHALRSNGRANTEMFCNMMDRSGEVLAYFADLVADEKPMLINTDTMQGRVSESTHLMYYWLNGDDLATRYDAFAEGLDLLVSKAQAAGANFLWNTPAIQLTTDDNGKVTGAVGRMENGKGDYVRVNASKGVLIATGNIANDDEMKECYCPIALDVQPLVAETHTGDGHKMALWVGADMDRPPFALGLSATNFGKGVGGFYAIPFLRVNKTGRRYCNETLGTHELAENQPLVNADCNQPEHTGYQIVDARYQQTYEAFGGNWERMQAASLEELGSGDEVTKADSLEALAEALGMDATVLTATVERYNAIVESGIDSDFGVDAETLAHNGGVHEAPFYAIKQTGCLGYTIGGPRTNRELQVINTQGEPIDGLWICGNAMGGQWGYEFSYQDFGGTNKMGAVVGGVLAVKSMLGTFDEAL